MSSELIIAVVLAFAVLILVGSIGYGLFGSIELAQGVRDAEAEEHVVIEEIRHLTIRQPEKFKHERFDRHPFYVGVALGTWAYAWCILGGASFTSNLATLSYQTRVTMAICFLIGSTLVLIGTSMGFRFWKWRFKPEVHDNVVSDRLSDDIRLPYTFSIAGMLILGPGMAIYASTSFRSTTGSLGGWLTALLAVMCAIVLFVDMRRISQYSKARSPIIAAAKASIRLRGDTDAGG